MIVLLGIKKNSPISVREKLSIKSKNYEKAIIDLKNEFQECAILSTCNRIEVYLNCKETYNKPQILQKVFKILNWDKDLVENIFVLCNDGVYKHLFELACGFHSRIIGEDQILGQIRECHRQCKNIGALKGELLHLLESALCCGKEFRTISKLYEIPVSSSSIVVNKAMEIGFNNIMVIGYGEVGTLVTQYLKSRKVENILVVVRDKEKYSLQKICGITFLNYEEKKRYINEMDVVISCTSAPHTVITKEEINDYGNSITIFDLALPRDVEEGIEKNKGVTLYNIDDISRIDDENKELRIEKMNEYRWVIEKHIYEFISWKSARRLSPTIREIKNRENEICEQRKTTYINKVGDENKELVEMLIRSTSDFYVNRAIEVMKKELLEGDGEKCMEIIEKIFLKEI